MLPKVAKQFLNMKYVSKSPKKSPICSATLVSKFVAKKFQKSLNLVTLDVIGTNLVGRWVIIVKQCDWVSQKLLGWQWV